MTDVRDRIPLVRLFPVAEGRCPCCGRTTPIWTPDAIIEAFQRWTRHHDKVPSTHDWRKAKLGHPSGDQVVEVFGSFDNGRRAAGLEFVRKNGVSHRWDRESIIQAIFRWRFVHNGRLPRAHDWASNASDEWPSTKTVQRHFGTWNGAIVAAGYKPTHAKRSAKGYRAIMAARTKAAA
jgi:hypothetical protein